VVILCDTREQRPLKFRRTGNITGTVREKLDVGDYAVRFSDGSVPPIRFERKGLGDLFKTMTRDYSRFKREIEMARDTRLKLIIIIESSLEEVSHGYPYSKYPGPSCVRKLFTLWIRYGVLPVFCESREEMVRYITETFSAVGREYVLKSA